MKKKAIGLFGGSFDPIHLGHVHLAISMREIYNLDEVIFSPAFCSPHKTKRPPLANSNHRLKMVELATKSIAGFSVDDFEINAGNVSYTIDLLKHFYEKRKGENFDLYLILANRAASSLHTWKKIDEILELATPLIGIYSEYKNSLTEVVPAPFLSKIKKGFTEIPAFDIQSTDIRGRLKENLYCGHILDAKVLDYIFNHQLYSLLT